MSDSAHPASASPDAENRATRATAENADAGRVLEENRVQDSSQDREASRPDVSSPVDESRDSGVTSVEVLIDDFHVLVFRYAYRLCGNQADAEDLTQQTFLSAQQNLGQLRSAAKARSWLLTICRNRFLKSRRRQEPLAISATDIEIEKIPGDVQPNDDIDQERLQRIIGELPDEYRVVVMMFYFEQLTYREIAEQLDVKLGTVMSRLSRAKAKLRGLLFPNR